MEGKTTFETRNKRKLQSDAESRRRRHKGGMQINHHHKNDADIRMETIIYKLDSSNKIVLPMAQETNTDRDFLKYVQTYLEQASLSDNHGGRCSILDKPKVKHERARKSKRLSYESDTTIEEQTMPKTTRHHRRSSGRNTRTDEDVVADEDAIKYLYEKRPGESVNRNAKICSCQPRLQYKVDGSFIVPNEAAFTRVARVARDNGQTACELSEEQMLRCFQLVFKQLCTLNNVDGTVLNIDVATPTENPLRSIHNPTSNVQNPTSYDVIENTARQSYTPSPPAMYHQLPPQEIAPLPAATENHMMPEAALAASTQPPALTHQELQPRQQSQTELLTQSRSGKKMSQEQFFYPSNPKNTFTEPVETQVLGKQFDINNEPLPLPLPNRTGSYNDDATKRHSFHAAQQTNEMQQQQQHSQQHNNQQALAAQMNQHYYAGQEQQHQQQLIQQQQHQPQQLQQHQQQLIQQQQHQQQQQLKLQQQHLQLPPQQQQEYQRRRSSHRNSEARESTFMENYPTEFDWRRMIPLHRLSSARQSDATPKATEIEGGIGAGAGAVMNLQQQDAGRQTNVNYPMYPFGQRDGLQDVTADNVRVIPNIRVVDYGENECGMPNCAPGDNESYEYILMRVKKKKFHCPCD